MESKSGSQLNDLKRILKPDRIYRRSDFLKKVKHPDRAISTLISEGVIVKVIKGVYYRPAKKFFGETVPDDYRLVNKVLGRSKFLLIYPHIVNSLNLGLTQLENVVYVYNQKRHETLKLGNREFCFKRMFNNRFPSKATKEFLVVDLLNNINRLGELEEQVFKLIRRVLQSYDKQKLLENAEKYGKKRTIRFIKDNLGVN